MPEFQGRGSRQRCRYPDPMVKTDICRKDTTAAIPRPQMVRGTAHASLSRFRDTGDNSTWQNLNGLWEWEKASASSDPKFGRPLNGSILVPFPVESCLSGVAPASSAEIVQHMWYRLPFTMNGSNGVGSTNRVPQRTLLHFGAIDWQSAVYLNGKKLLNTDKQMNHTGGYSGIYWIRCTQPKWRKRDPCLCTRSIRQWCSTQWKAAYFSY